MMIVASHCVTKRQGGLEQIRNWFLESTCGWWTLCKLIIFSLAQWEEREWILKCSIAIVLQYIVVLHAKQLVKPGIYEEHRLCYFRRHEKMWSLEIKIEAGVDWEIEMLCESVWRVLRCIASVGDCSHEATIHSRLTLTPMTQWLIACQRTQRTQDSNILKPSQNIPRNLCHCAAGSTLESPPDCSLAVFHHRNEYSEWTCLPWVSASKQIHWIDMNRS